MTTEIKKVLFDREGLLVNIDENSLVINNETADAKRIKDKLGISVRFLNCITDGDKSSFIKADKIEANKWPLIRLITEIPGKMQKSDFLQNSYEMLIPMSAGVLKAGKLKDELTPGLLVIRK